MESANAYLAIPFKRPIEVVNQTMSMGRAFRMSIGIHKACFALEHLAQYSFLQEIIENFK